MPVFPQLERFFRFDDRLRRNCFPNAAHLAEHFELAHETARRTITLMRDRPGAPIEYTPWLKDYGDTRGSSELPFLPAGREKPLAILLVRSPRAHSAGDFISRAISKFSQHLFSATGTGDLTAKRLPQTFPASWHGYAPVAPEKFPTVTKTLGAIRRGKPGDVPRADNKHIGKGVK